MKEAKRPAKEYNHDTGKMEDTNLPHWQEYYRKLDAFNEMMEAKRPKPSDYGYQSADAYADEPGWTIEGGEEAYRRAVSQWDMSKSMDAPNKPGYYRANND